MTTDTRKERCDTCGHQRRYHHYSSASDNIVRRQFCSACEKGENLYHHPVHSVQWFLGLLEKEATP